MNSRDRCLARKLPYSQLPASLFLFFFATVRRHAVKTEIMPARNIRCRTTTGKGVSEGVGGYRFTPVRHLYGHQSHRLLWGAFYWNARHTRVRYPPNVGDIGNAGWRGVRKTFGDRTESEQEVSGANVKLSDSVSRNLRRSPKKSKTDRLNLRQYVGRLAKSSEKWISSTALVARQRKA